MKKYSTESQAGRKMAAAQPGRDLDVTEPAYPKAQKVDPSVCIPPQGDWTCGAVDINSPAYTGKFKG